MSMRVLPHHPERTGRTDALDLHPLRRWGGHLLRCLAAMLLLSIPWWIGCTESEVILDTVNPKQGFTGEASALTIFGKGFPTGDVKVTLLGLNSKIVLTSPTRVDESQIKASLPAEATPGQYDLELVFGDRKPLVLGGAFEVIAKSLRVYFIEVGQGDATLLISPSQKTMLIDSGPPGSAPQIEAVLQELNIRSIDHVIATHYDADHVGSFEALVNGPDGKARTGDDHEIREALWDPGGISKNNSYSRVRSRFSSVHKPLDGKSAASFPKIDLGGGVTVEVRTANGVVLGQDGTRRAVSCGTDANCLSIGTMITIGKVKLWTAGDLTGGGNDTPDVESELAKSIGRVDLYRSHHHGSKTSSNDALIKAMQPQVVVVSAGKENPYCHPHADILARYTALRDVWVFVTSAGSNAADCSKSTEDRLQVIGGRAVVSAGTFYLTADPKGFTIKVPSEPAPVRWTAR